MKEVKFEWAPKDPILVSLMKEAVLVSKGVPFKDVQDMDTEMFEARYMVYTMDMLQGNSVG